MTTDSPFKCLTMKRKLAKQMCAQWRSNVWLVVELMVVSVVLWYVNDYISSALPRIFRMRASTPRRFTL